MAIKVVFGGWYQRTTLHLSEIQRFLLNAESNGDLSKIKLKKLQGAMQLKKVERKVGYLEYLSIKTKSEIEIKYFEDGLYTISKSGEDYKKLKKEIEEYFQKRFEPAINYLFSLGAPTPKILSNMKKRHPIVIGHVGKNIKKYNFGKMRAYKETIAKDVKVSKTKDNIVITVAQRRRKELDLLIEMQIFFSEFKLQLHKYLDIHRSIWEDISAIKEKEFIKGSDVSKHKSKLESYQKTIQLIRNRINQMKTYASTRQTISKNWGIDKRLDKLFQYRFEDLFNTLDYIKEIWSMTIDYVDSGIKVLTDIENKTTSKGIKSIQLLVGIGVIMGVLRYLNEKTFDNIQLTTKTIIFIVVIGILGLILDKITKISAKNKKYKLKFIERSEKI